jgi:hypothetical protein
MVVAKLRYHSHRQNRLVTGRIVGKPAPTPVKSAYRHMGNADSQSPIMRLSGVISRCDTTPSEILCTGVDSLLEEHLANRQAILSYRRNRSEEGALAGHRNRMYLRNFRFSRLWAFIFPISVHSDSRRDHSTLFAPFWEISLIIRSFFLKLLHVFIFRSASFRRPFDVAFNCRSQRRHTFCPATALAYNGGMVRCGANSRRQAAETHSTNCRLSLPTYRRLDCMDRSWLRESSRDSGQRVGDI